MTLRPWRPSCEEVRLGALRFSAFPIFYYAFSLFRPDQEKKQQEERYKRQGEKQRSATPVNWGIDHFGSHVDA
jgi:hypothetical protein